MIYTYSKLIAGEALAEAICSARQQSAHDNGNLDDVRYWTSQAVAHQDNIRRYRLARALHGDVLFIQRRY